MRIRMSIFRPFMTFNRRPEDIRSWTLFGPERPGRPCPFAGKALGYPGQTEAFVIPSFAMQIARIEAGLQSPVVRVGNLDAERDFLDVRDVTAAYALAVAKSDDIPSGTILNIASGLPRRIRDILDGLVGLSSMPIEVELD